MPPLCPQSSGNPGLDSRPAAPALLITLSPLGSPLAITGCWCCLCPLGRGFRIPLCLTEQGIKRPLQVAHLSMALILSPCCHVAERRWWVEETPPWQCLAGALFDTP